MKNILAMKNCPHCEPCQQNPLHLHEKIGKLLNFYWAFRKKPSNNIKKKNNFIIKYENFVMDNFFRLLLLSKIAREQKATPKPTLDNISRVIIGEANKINQPLNIIYCGRLQTRFFSTLVANKKVYFERLPTSQAWQDYPINFDDKDLLKDILRQKNIPSPKGKGFLKPSKALIYARSNLNFPLVVKPQTGSLSKHTTCQINNEKDLLSAIKIAKIVSSLFVVEEHITGDVYRATLVAGKIAAICLRAPASVTGDGKADISSLIARKNSLVNKKSKLLKNPYPQIVVVNESLRHHLRTQGLDLDSILAENKKVILQPKLLQIAGSETIDFTDDINPRNIKVLKDTAGLCDSAVVGIDLIAEDITKPFTEQSFAVIEINSLPNIDMHHFPTAGQPRNVAKLVWESALLK